jgi:hypothetical protein
MIDIFTLLLAFQAKHFIADFPLQGRYMLGKFKADWGFVAPLSAHVSVHACFTLLIAVVFGAPLAFAAALAVFDAVIHFAMDRLKASPRLLGRYKPDGPYFWWALGLDQCVHHLTHYAIIWFLVTKTF